MCDASRPARVLNRHCAFAHRCLPCAPRLPGQHITCLPYTNTRPLLNTYAVHVRMCGASCRARRMLQHCAFAHVPPLCPPAAPGRLCAVQSAAHAPMLWDLCPHSRCRSRAPRRSLQCALPPPASVAVAAASSPPRCVAVYLPQCCVRYCGLCFHEWLAFVPCHLFPSWAVLGLARIRLGAVLTGRAAASTFSVPGLSCRAASVSPDFPPGGCTSARYITRSERRYETQTRDGQRR